MFYSNYGFDSERQMIVSLNSNGAKNSTFLTQENVKNPIVVTIVGAVSDLI